MSICPTNGTITSISNPFFPTTPSNIPTPITLTLHFIAIIPTVFTSVGQTCKCISGSLLRKLKKNMKKKHTFFFNLQRYHLKNVWDWALFKKLNRWILSENLFLRACLWKHHLIKMSGIEFYLRKYCVAISITFAI